jgi:hypothetical protein
MNQSFIRRFLAIILSISLVWTSGGVLDAALTAPDIFAAPSALPQFQLQPPGQLGRIADYFNAPSPRTLSLQGEGGADAKRRAEGEGPFVILIQDLHAHYGVQKNIAGLLDFLAEKLKAEQPKSEQPRGGTTNTAVPPSGISASLHFRNLVVPPSADPPFALAVEGASGPIDSSVMALFPDEKVKLAASDYLMREGELTGAEFFAIKHGLPHLLVGVENEKYYLVHRDLFRKTLTDREELVKTLKGLQSDINALPRYVFYKNKPLWEFQKQVEAYDKGEISTHDFIAILTSSLPAGRQAPTVSGVGSIDLKRDFPVLASFAANSRFGTMDDIRSATGEFLTQIQGQLTPQ